MKKLVSSLALAIGILSISATAFAADNCTPCTSTQKTNGEKACAQAFGGSAGDYGASTCTHCKDNNRLYVTCWRNGAEQGKVDINNLFSTTVKETKQQAK